MFELFVNIFVLRKENRIPKNKKKEKRRYFDKQIGASFYYSFFTN